MFKNSFKALLLFVVLIVPYYLFKLFGTQAQPNKGYKTEQVCGLFLGFGGSQERYLGRGKPNISLTLQFENYGWVHYGKVNSFGRDIETGVDFSQLQERKSYCFVIRKPANAQIWTDDSRIVEILSIGS